MDIPSTLIVHASLENSDMAGTHVYTSPLSGFPSQGNSFGAISSGNAADATRPNSEGCLTMVLGGWCEVSVLKTGMNRRRQHESRLAPVSATEPWL